MAGLTDEQAQLFRDQNYGWATTLRQDGSPHSTVVWLDYEDGHVLFNTAKPRAKWRHLEHDPRVNVAVFADGDPYQYVSVTGRAELVWEGANDHIDKLARKYTEHESYPWHKDDETRVIVRVAPEKVASSI